MNTSLLPAGLDVPMFCLNEMFTSIQGEGFFTGEPAHFVRFQGCPVRCHFCDTPTSWVTQTPQMSGIAMMQAIQDMVISYPNVHSVVLTGGEPLYDNPGLCWLVDELRAVMSMHVQIETSGTVIEPAMDLYLKNLVHVGGLYICVSPKAPNETDAEYLPVVPELLDSIFQIKFPVSSERDIEQRIPAFLNAYGNKMPNLQHIYLQPVNFASSPDLTRRARELAVDCALKNGVGISLQTHKYLNVR